MLIFCKHTHTHICSRTVYMFLGISTIYLNKLYKLFTPQDMYETLFLKDKTQSYNIYSRVNYFFNKFQLVEMLLTLCHEKIL